MKAVILLIVFVALVVLSIYKANLEEPSYSKEEIAEMLTEIRKEIIHLNSERNQNKISTWEYIGYLSALDDRLKKIEKEMAK